MNVGQLNQQLSAGIQQARIQASTYTNQKFNESINYTNQQSSQLRNQINTVQQGANQGVATVAAMLTAIRTPSPGKSTISLGGGYYGTQAGTALAMAHRSREGKWQATASVGIPASIVSGANIAAAGAISYEF